MIIREEHHNPNNEDQQGSWSSFEVLFKIISHFLSFYLYKYIFAPNSALAMPSASIVFGLVNKFF